MMATMCVPKMLLFALVVVLLVTPTCCNAARALRDDDDVDGGGRPEIRNLSEENQEFEKRSSNWSNQESGDDAVPTSSDSTLVDNYAAKYKNWVRFQEEEVTQDYGDTPAAANPSVPCC